MRSAPSTTTASASILVGDLNIAPLEHDVWSHKQLLKVVSHTPVETEGFEAMRKAGGWVDLMRHNVPAEQKLYTWWSYRAADWAASDRGRRLDHIWSSANLVAEPRRHRDPARRARLGPAVRPRAGHRPVRSRLEAVAGSLALSAKRGASFSMRLIIACRSSTMRSCSVTASLGIFLQDAAEHLAVEPQDFGVGRGVGAGQPPACRRSAPVRRASRPARPCRRRRARRRARGTG